MTDETRKEGESGETKGCGNRGKGRRKGSQNKLTRAIKEALEEAFEEVGGVDYLVTIAQDDPRTFCGLLGKIIPTQVNAKVEDARFTKEQRDAVIAALVESEG